MTDDLRPRHNHVTRDIKPAGQCPACDEFLVLDAAVAARQRQQSISEAPGEDSTPMTDTARDVLVHWALPLLARARRMADDLEHTTDDHWELLANDIVTLIGHSVTDQPPAPELDAILAGSATVSSTSTARRGTRAYFLEESGRDRQESITGGSGSVMECDR